MTNKVLTPHSLERQLIAIVLACFLLPTLMVGWVGYSIAYVSIQTEEVQIIGRVADEIDRDLVFLFDRTNARAEAFIKDVSSTCFDGPKKIDLACAMELLDSFSKSEKAVGAVLRLNKTGDELTVGRPAVQPNGWTPFQPDQLARFSEPVANHDRTYDITAEDRHRGMRLVVTFPVALVQGLFGNRPGLGRTGEAFLADAEGFFITKPAYPSVQGHARPISTPPMQACLAGKTGEAVDESYRDVTLIHGYHFVPEIGGGCVMAHIDQSEAFASLWRLTALAAGLAVLLIAVASIMSIIIGRRIAGPITKLTLVTRDIIGGNYQARADVSGNNEVSELARAFNLMGEHVLKLLGDLGEHNARLEERVRDRTAALEAANQKLALLSTSDGLTGLANRRQLDHVLDVEWRRAVRHAGPIALVMVDVDHFKHFNDHYGHQEGDECLRQIASVLAHHAQRSGELAARYGGEEFAIVLPGADADEAGALAEEVRRAIVGLAMPHVMSEFAVVTVSLGVASVIPDGSEGVSGLIAAADRALYRAKAAGRNRVELMPTTRAVTEDTLNTLP